jgi:hypothetical protein
MLGCATNKENQELNRKVEILQKGYGELLGENRMYRRMFKTALQESYERHLKNKEK